MPATEPTIPEYEPGDPAGLARALRMMAGAEPPYGPRVDPVEVVEGPPAPAGAAAPPPYHVEPEPEPDAQAEHDDLVGKLTGKDDESEPDGKPVEQLSKVEAAAKAKAHGLDDTGTVHELRARLVAAGITEA